LKHSFYQVSNAVISVCRRYGDHLHNNCKLTFEYESHRSTGNRNRTI